MGTRTPIPTLERQQVRREGRTDFKPRNGPTWKMTPVVLSSNNPQTIVCEEEGQETFDARRPTKASVGHASASELRAKPKTQDGLFCIERGTRVRVSVGRSRRLKVRVNIFSSSCV